MNSPKSIGFELVDVRLGVKLHYVVPVINFAELALLLQKSGYNISQTSPAPVYFTGVRGAVQIYIDGMKGVFGATAANIDNTVEAIDEIFAVANQSFDFDLNKYVSFFEIEINATCNIHKDVYVIMAKLFQDSSDMKMLNKILKGNYAQISLKLTPAGKNINNQEWYDLTIEPKVNSAGNILIVRVLCRSPRLKDIVENAKRTEANVTSIIEKVLSK
jgi:hypothetical protein